jgi:hypothetical protein
LSCVNSDRKSTNLPYSFVFSYVGSSSNIILVLRITHHSSVFR